LNLSIAAASAVHWRRNRI